MLIIFNNCVIFADNIQHFYYGYEKTGLVSKAPKDNGAGW